MAEVGFAPLADRLTSAVSPWTSVASAVTTNGPVTARAVMATVTSSSPLTLAMNSLAGLITATWGPSSRATSENPHTDRLAGGAVFPQRVTSAGANSTSAAERTAHETPNANVRHTDKIANPPLLIADLQSRNRKPTGGIP